MRTLAVDQNIVKFNNFKSNEKEPKVTEVPVKKDTKKPMLTKDNAMPLVTAAVAVASLGVSAVALTRGKKGVKGAGEFEGKIEGLSKNFEAINSKISELKTEIASKPNSLGEEITSKLTKFTEEINALKDSSSTEALNNKVQELFNFVNEVSAKYSLNSKGFFSEVVEINGKQMQLATVFNQVGGTARENMEKTLRTEALNRMLGLGKPLEALPEGGMIRIPTSEFKGFASTGGLAAVPKEIANNLAEVIAGKQNIRVGVDMPLYRGNVSKSEVKGQYTRLYNDLRATKDGKFEYIQTELKDKKEPVVKVLAKLEKVNTMNLKITTDAGVENHVVDVLMGENKVALDFAKVSENLSADLKTKIENLKPNEKFEYGTLGVEKDENGVIKAYAKVKTIFYDDGKGGKFDLNVPVDKAKDIYSDKAIASGETERFVYFDKFFFEQWLRNEETKAPLSVDMVLGNDWHTGPIAAMSRLLTTVNKEYGMNPLLAEKVYNTPVVVILHNATLAGSNWGSQEKLLNVLFGEQAATIAKNAHMPDIHLPDKASGLGGHLFNGLMEGTGVAPQMMAASYADYILPVSKGYAEEIATSEILGGPRRKIFEFRLRKGEYDKVNNLKDIALNNRMSSELITSTKPTMIGITNGCDRANNTFTEANAKKLAKNLNLPEGTFMPYEKGVDELVWHNTNKRAGIEKIKADINLAREHGENPMSIELPELTDLTGVTEKTPVFVSAGRIEDQKGLDILGEAIVEFYKGYEGKDYPVFYIQGIGNPQFKEYILNAKREVAKTNPEAAKRIVFANLFHEAGRYDCSKLIADFSLMPSWYEPCGLSHKEIAQYSGAGAVVNRTGGLIDGLKEGVNVFVSEFNPDRNCRGENAKNYAKALQEAVNVHADEAKYRTVIKEMMNTNFDWAREGGPIYDYLAIFEELGVISKDVAKYGK